MRMIAMRMMNEKNMHIRESCAQFSFIVKSKGAKATNMKIKQGALETFATNLQRDLAASSEVKACKIFRLVSKQS